MKISVALCTYNGARFLADQLASIGRQSRPPDELVICDDGSTDSTLDIARAFAAAAPFPVRIEMNPTRLGSSANFGNAISLCRADTIALADQDDVWHSSKLARLGQTLESNMGVGLVFSNAAMVDETLNSMGYSLWDAIQFGPAECHRFRTGRAFESLLRLYRVTGATMAFRSCFRDLVLPIPPGWMHDAWIALLIAGVADCMPIDEPLIQYRQHLQQQLGERKRSLYAQFLVARGMGEDVFDATVIQFSQALERLRGHSSFTWEKESKLVEKVQHCRQRACLHRLGAARLAIVAREWWKGNYTRYSRGWKAAAQDLFLS